MGEGTPEEGRVGHRGGNAIWLKRHAKGEKEESRRVKGWYREERLGGKKGTGEHKKWEAYGRRTVRYKGKGKMDGWPNGSLGKEEGRRGKKMT